MLLEDPRFVRSKLRRENEGPLREAILAWTAEHTKHEAMQILGKEGVPASAVFDTHDLFNDPHLAARDFVKTIEHPKLGPVKLLGWPPRMSRSEVPISPAPFLGRHTEEVLSADLGLSGQDVEDLRARGVLGNESQFE